MKNCTIEKKDYNLFFNLQGKIIYCRIYVNLMKYAIKKEPLD